MELELPIDRDPKTVKAWWTELPDDYVAKDPKEQPFRIRTLKRHEDGRTLETSWRTPMGATKSIERMRLHDDGSWTFEVESAMFGVGAHDTFRAVPDGDGTRLLVRTEFLPKTVAHRLFAPILAPMMRSVFRSTFTSASRICERDAP